jgi:hypothetical protein
VLPAHVLTFSTRRGIALSDFSVEVTYTDALLGGNAGDGVTKGSRTLDESSPLDIFIIPPEGIAGGRLEERGMAIVATEADLLFVASWTGVNGKQTSGEVAIVWSAADRRLGRRATRLDGADALTLLAHTRAPNGPPPEIAMRRRRRVPYSSWLARSRRRTRWRRYVLNDDGTRSTRVTSLTVRGLRGFRSDARLRIAQPTGAAGSGLTIVVGANNAGKSTIWESFDAVARKAKSDVSFSEGRRNRHTAGGVHIRLDWADGTAFVLKSRDAETSETSADWAPDGGKAARPVELVSVPSRRQFQTSFGKNMTSQRDWMTFGDFSRSRQFDPSSQFTGRLFDLHNNDHKKLRFDALMTEVLGHELKWSIDLADGQQGQSYYLKIATGDGVNHTSEGLGDGIISLLFIVNALYDSEPGTLITIDEPELSLHPQYVRRLGRIIARLAADRQIVVFTHSPALVSWDDIEAGAEIVRVFKVSDESRVAQPSRAAVDEITRARGGWRNPHALGIDANSTLFLDDGVLVVEGQEDAALMPHVFEQLGIKFHGTVFGWGSGGESNVGRILSLLKELGFARVAAILDNDVPMTVSKLKAEFPDFFVMEIPAADIRDKKPKNFDGKSGLMDERGRDVKPELVEAARAVLTQVSDRLAPDYRPANGA